MEQKTQSQPQQLNSIPPDNKNKIIIAIILGGLLIGVGFVVWEKVLHNRGGVSEYGLFPPPFNHLELSTTSGSLPLTVSVTGPEALLSNKNNTWSGWEGCRFNIDWGDGVIDPTPKGGKEYCANALTHTYKTAGTFVVEAYTFYSNPDDSRTTDWAGTTQVRVKSGTTQTATSTTSQNISVSEIELAFGGGFQSTTYHVKDSKLTYDHSDVHGEQHSTTVLTSADLANLDSLLVRYSLDTLHTDPLPGPDMPYYYVMIIKDSKTYKLRFVSTKNPGYPLALELKQFFFDHSR